MKTSMMDWSNIKTHNTRTAFIEMLDAIIGGSLILFIVFICGSILYMLH